MQLRAMYAFHLVYFFVYSITTFLPRYFGELGMADSQIGILMSLPAIAGVLFQPYFGMLSDRVRLKKYVLIGLIAALAAVCFIADRMTGFAALFIGMTLFNIIQLPIAPIYSAISLEYTRDIGRPYGPIRVVGTVGYQLGALLTGLVLASNLQGLFRLLGFILILSCAISVFLPPIRGHQHGRTKVSMGVLLRDKHIVALFVMVLIGAITSQYYQAFFSKHMGDLGIGNTVTGWMLIISVALEVPFLLVADKLARKVSIWNWLLVGFVLNAVRWLGLAFCKSVGLLLLFQLPGVSVMACFEFFPCLYLNARVDDTLQGSAQTALMIVSFGIAKIIGSLAGGYISDLVGIPAVFAFNGALLLAAAICLWRPTRRLIASETTVL